MQWEFVHGLFNQAVYGGRIDNPVDSDVIISYLEEYFNNSFFSGSGRGPKVKFGPGISLPSSCDFRVKFLTLIYKKNAKGYKLTKMTIFMNFRTTKKQ